MDDKKTIVSPPKKGTKKNKKKAIIAMVLVMALVIGGTLAYLGTRSEDKENIFVGSKDIDLTLMEPSWDDTQEKYTKPEKDRAEKYSPKGEYLKNPMLYNSSDNDAEEWVAMKVSFKLENPTICYLKYKDSGKTYYYMEKEGETATWKEEGTTGWTKKEMTRTAKDTTTGFTTPWDTVITDTIKNSASGKTIEVEPKMNPASYADISKLINIQYEKSGNTITPFNTGDTGNWLLICTESDVTNLASGTLNTSPSFEKTSTDKWAIFMYKTRLLQNEKSPITLTTQPNDTNFTQGSYTVPLFNQINILTQKYIVDTSGYKQENPKKPEATDYPNVNVYLPKFEIVLEGAAIKNESTYLDGSTSTYKSMVNITDDTAEADNIKKALIELFGVTVG